MGCHRFECATSFWLSPGVVDASRQTRVRAADGSPAAAYISAVRSEISEPISGAQVLAPRSISVHGVCAAYVSRELARYRNVSESLRLEAVSPRHSGRRGTQHARGCQRET